MSVKACPVTPEEYLEKYKAAKINADKVAVSKAIADKLAKYKDTHYQPVGDVVGCPWWVVACIHNQECGEDVGVFKAVLHNGEKIVGTGKKTTLVPKGKGPFATWNDAAINALGGPGKMKGKASDIGTALAFLERYNGMGYRAKGVPSPYLWSYTDQYVKGKYVADGKYSATAVSKQSGVAAIMKSLGL